VADINPSSADQERKAQSKASSFILFVLFQNGRQIPNLEPSVWFKMELLAPLWRGSDRHWAYYRNT